MPGMDGIDSSRRPGQHGHLPFILFTGKGREQVVIRAINEGADFHLQKGGTPGPSSPRLAHQTRSRSSGGHRAGTRGTRAAFPGPDLEPSDIIRILDRDGLITYDSDSGPRILGTASGSALGRSPLESVHPDDRDRVRDALAEVFAGTSPGTPTGFRIRHGDGRWIAVEPVAADLLRTPGVDGIATTTWPVEARRWAEEALLHSERRFSRAEEIAGLGHWELDLETGIVRSSSGAQALYGLFLDQRPLADVQRSPARAPPPPRLGPPRPRGAGPAVRSGVRHPPRRRRARAGTPRRRGRPGPADRFGILPDITDRNRTEGALRASQERYRRSPRTCPSTSRRSPGRHR